MSVDVTCPGCQQEVAVPEKFRGKRVRCSGCKEIFTVPAEEPIIPLLEPDDDPRDNRRQRSRREEDDEDDYDRPRRRSRRDEEDEEDEEDRRPRRRSLVRRNSARKPAREERDWRSSRGRGSDWQWSWNPLIGIMYGPIPVGVIIVLIIAMLGGLAALSQPGRR